MINPTPDACFAEPSSIYGRWATAGYGRLAKIDGSIETQTGTIYYGTRAHGGSWSTRVPATIHPKDEAVLNAELSK